MLDSQTLYRIANASTTAKDLAKYLNQRRRNRGDTNLNRVRAALSAGGGKYVEADFATFWAQLEAMGVGERRPKRGQPLRFVWHYDLRQVAEALRTGSRDVVPAGDAQVQTGVAHTPLIRVTIDTGLPGRGISLEVPQDVTEAELERLRATLRSLR